MHGRVNSPTYAFFPTTCMVNTLNDFLVNPHPEDIFSIAFRERKGKREKSIGCFTSVPGPGIVSTQSRGQACSLGIFPD